MATIVKRQGKKGVSWKVVIRRKGADTITETFRLKRDAEEWARRMEGSILDGEFYEIQESRKRTLAEMIDRYCQDFLDRKSAEDAYRHLKWWKEQIGHLRIASVTPAVIIECRQKLKRGAVITRRKHWGKDVPPQHPRNNATCNRYMAALSSAFTTAVKEMQWAKRNPVTEIASLKEPKGRVRFLDDDERERLLAACRASSNPYLHPIVLLALSTGMRLGEIRGLTWKNVDLVRRTITLTETKNGTTRSVPVTSKAFEVFDGLKRRKVRRIDTDLVFPGLRLFNKGPVYIRSAWVIAVKEAGIEDFRFHDLRHCCASYLAMNGCSLLEIAAVLGHKTLAMVQRYAHLSEQHTRGILERLSQDLFGPPDDVGK